jgi:superfamily II DNA/RNA helicase
MPTTQRHPTRSPRTGPRASTNRREESGREKSGREKSGREGSGREGSGREGSGRVSPAAASIPVPTANNFAELGVPPRLVTALAARGIEVPFPIQASTLPDALAGRHILGRGRTGSGKTVAFAIPTVVALTNSGHRRETYSPRALILVPTRELATQVADTVGALAKATGLTVTTVFGGVGQSPQVAALRNGVDILVACPGRLEDLIRQKRCRLDRVEITVLDEADYMADLGFLPAVTRLLDQTPPGGQRMLFSATLDNGVGVLVRRYLVDPATHSVDAAVAPVSTMSHHVFAVDATTKSAVIHELASGMERSLLFTRTKHGAKRLAAQLTAAGTPALDLHGNLSQKARERNLAAFSSGTVKVLVATDVAARGIHVDGIALVVHTDPPTEHKAYLHRSGRTARAGAAGAVVTVMTPDQRSDVRTLIRRAGIAPVTTSVVPGSAEIGSVVGPKAPHVTPSAIAAPSDDARPARSGSPRARRSGPRQPQRSAASRSRSAVTDTGRRPRRSEGRRRAA